MAKVKRLKLDIDLEELFDKEVPDRALREAIGGAIIEKITERTESGVDKNGNAFKPYSKSYTDSLQFKAFGKSSNVDLTLTGDMLAGMTITSQDEAQITLGWEDPTLNTRAFAHITGYEGHPTIKNGPKRDFFGVTKEELLAVKEEFSDIVDSLLEFKMAARSSGEEEFRRAAVSALESILSTEDEAG